MPVALLEVLIQRCLSPAAETDQTDEWMHKLSYSLRCPGFPHVSPKSQQSRYSSEQNTCPCFILLLFLFLLWKPCHFCGWLNHLMGFWGFPRDEDVHWGLFTKRTERSCSDTQYLGPLHRKPHSLLPSHKGQPHSWSFTCVFIYLKGNYHLGFLLMLVISDFYSKRIHTRMCTHTHTYMCIYISCLAAWPAVLVWMLLSEAQTICPSRQEHVENCWGYLSLNIRPCTTVTLGAYFRYSSKKKPKTKTVFLLIFHIQDETYILHLHLVLDSTLSFLAAQSFLKKIYWSSNFAMSRLTNKTSRVLLLLAVHIKMLSVLSCGQHFHKMWLKVILSNLAFIIVLRKL